MVIRNVSTQRAGTVGMQVASSSSVDEKRSFRMY